MRLLERSPIAAARLEDAERVREAYQQCRDTARAAYLTLLAAGGPERELRAARGRMAAADLQLCQARKDAMAAWCRHE